MLTERLADGKVPAEDPDAPTPPRVTRRLEPEAPSGVVGDVVTPAARHSCTADASWLKASTATSIKSPSMDRSPFVVTWLMIWSIVELEIESRRACLFVGAAETLAIKEAVAASSAKRMI